MFVQPKNLVLSDIYVSKILTSPYWLFIIVALVETYLFWPGILRPDSIDQMNLAQSVNFTTGSDHHPPIMAFVWHYINQIIPGAGGILLLHEILFWSAIYCLYQSLSHKLSRIVLLSCCFLPQIFILRVFILKDISFTVCFLLVISLIIHATVHHRRIKFAEILAMSVLLFYGSAVKYQALFLAPIVIFWIIKCYRVKSSQIITTFYTVLYSGCLIVAVNSFNSHTAAPSYAWQYVKLYDLAGISIRTHKILFPQFVMKDMFTFDRLQQLYTPTRVDDMVFTTNSILKKGSTPPERDALMAYWNTTVLDYPWAYLQHRASVLMAQINLSPIKSPAAIKSNYNDSPAIFMIIGNILERYHLMTLLQIMTSLAPYLILSLIYIRSSWQQQLPVAQAVGLMNFVGLTLVAVLFIFSMAAEARYVYLSSCLIHFSHAFALEKFYQNRSIKKLIEFDKAAH